MQSDSKPKSFGKKLSLEAGLPLVAGLLGASGVALAAAASHLGSDQLLGNASVMNLAHAPALLALYACRKTMRGAVLAGSVLGIGTLLFSGDLVARQFMGTALFPMAAPLGGMAMIAGWLIVMPVAFTVRRE